MRDILITFPDLARLLEIHGARKLDVPTTIQIDEEVFALIELHRQPGDTDEEALIRALQATVLGSSSRGLQ